MELTIRAENYSDLKNKVHALSTEMLHGEDRQMTLPLDDKKTIGKKAKTKQIVEESIVNGEDENEPLEAQEATEDVIEKPTAKSTTPKNSAAKDSSKIFDKKEVETALQEVFNKHGIQEARNVLKPFGASALREVPVDRYGDVIKACKIALK